MANVESFIPMWSIFPNLSSLPIGYPGWSLYEEPVRPLCTPAEGRGVGRRGEVLFQQEWRDSYVVTVVETEEPFARESAGWVKLDEDMGGSVL